MVKFHESLSEQSVRFRFFQPLKLSRRIAHERLTRVCHTDYNRLISLVVDYHDPETGERQILGVGRLNKLPWDASAEFALLLRDRWQNLGLGSALLRRLVQIGKDEKLDRIVADILPENSAMQRVCEKVGFQLKHEPGEPVVKAAIKL